MLENKRVKETAQRLIKAREMQLEEALLTIQVLKNRAEKMENEEEKAKLKLRIKNAEATVIPELERDIAEFTEVITG